VTRLLALSLLAALVPACRGGLNSNCRCASDCRAGLVCQAENLKVLADDQCYDAGVIGACVEPENDDQGEGPDLVATEPPPYYDLPSKRDFQPEGSLSDSMTAGETTGTSTTGDTSTGTTGTSGTSTGDTTGTSTGDTTGTSTGDTSTGTTGTSTGNTSTGTTDASTGSTT
jgi:hypothetical protein